MIYSPALNTPWNPGRESPLFDYQGDYVRIYTAAQADRWLDQAKSGDANRVPAQNTQAAMPTWAASDADFRGHGALTFGAGISMATGVFSSPLAQSMTYYAVGKWGSGTSIEFLFDGIDTSNRQALYIDNVNQHVYAGADIWLTVSAKNQLFVYCIVVNGISSALYKNDMTTPIKTGNVGAQAALGLRIGSDFSGANSFLGKACQLTGFTGSHAAAMRTRIGKYYGDKYGQVVT